MLLFRRQYRVEGTAISWMTRRNELSRDITSLIVKANFKSEAEIITRHNGTGDYAFSSAYYRMFHQNIIKNRVTENHRGKKFQLSEARIFHL